MSTPNYEEIEKLNAEMERRRRELRKVFYEDFKRAAKAITPPIIYDAVKDIKDTKDILVAYNQLKFDVQKAKLVNSDGTPIEGRNHADNYAHSVADAKIAQKGLWPATVAFVAGIAKEARDLTLSTINGHNISQTWDDNCKDMNNNIRGLKWGLENPNGNAEQYFAQLDLNSNTIISGYNNGIAQARPATTADIMKLQYMLAQNKINALQARPKVMQGRRAAIDAKKFEGSKIPDPKKPKKEKIQTPMAPSTPSVRIPIPAWQQKNGKNM